MIDKNRTLREVFVAVASILGTAAAVWVCTQGQVLWALVPIPAAIGLAYHFLNLSTRYMSQRAVVEEYRTKMSSDFADDLDAHAPTLAGMVWAASLLTAVFAIPAVVSHGGLLLLSGAEKPDEALGGLAFSGLGGGGLIVFRTLRRVHARGPHAPF